MKTRVIRNFWAAALLVVSLISGVTSTALGEPVSKPFEFKTDGKGILTAQAFADRSGVVPGEPFNILISIKMQNGWHVYWSNPNATGLPTKVEMKLPAGFEVGRTRYPVPHSSYSKELDETSYLLPEESALVVPVRPPAKLKAGETIEIVARLSWLSCKENCIPGKTDLVISLPVVEAGKSSAVNAEIFKDGIRALPSAMKDAPNVKLAAKIDPATAKPGTKLTAILEAEIAAKMHMQSNTPFEEFMIPAVVYVERVDGFEIGAVTYPKPHVRQDAMMGKLSEYAGKVAFTFPVEVADVADKSPRVIRGVLQYQICTDAGTCFPPEHVAFEIPVQMAGGEKPTGEDWMAASLIAGGDSTEAGDTGGDSPTAGGGSASNGAANGTKNNAGWFNRVQNALLGMGFAGTLLLAVLGGLVLNVMPCVLPVVSLKALSFVRQAKEDRFRIFLLGFSYCAGILSFFGILAVLFYSFGQGWGELFQSPVVILILSGIVTAFAMSLFGVFTVFTPQVINELGQKAEEREGLSSAFLTGMLATVLGTACTAPFLSAAVAAASKYPANQGAFIFLAVGFGMALPFLGLSIFPAWLKVMPKPGKWMETFEVVMGFLLLGTVVWLMYPLGDLIGAWGLVLAIIWLLGVALAVWVKGRAQYGDPFSRKCTIHAAALGIILLSWFGPLHFWYSIDELQAATAEHDRLYNIGRRFELLGGADEKIIWGPEKWHSDDEIPWLPYDQELVRRFVEAGYPVFVDFTASWCPSCKTNMKTSINIEASRRLFRELNVVPFEADYSREQPWMKEVMNSYDRASVPVYLVFSPNNPNKPEILPEILSPGLVEEALKNAGASKAGGAAATPN